MHRVNVVVEQHPDGYIAYPLGFKGALVGEGDTAEEALADAESATRFAVETFGAAAFADELPLLDAFMADALTPHPLDCGGV